MHEYDPVFGNHSLTHKCSQAMAIEVKRGSGPIYLDMTHLSPEEVSLLKAVLPLQMKAFESLGIVKGNRFVRKVEWVSTNFGTLGTAGGIKVGPNCETTIAGLYAAGDAAAKPDRGFGAIALPFAAMSSAMAGLSASKYAHGTGLADVEERHVEKLVERMLAPLKRKDGIEPDHIVLAVQEAIIPYDVYIIMHDSRLTKALTRVAGIERSQVPMVKAYDPHYLVMAHEAINIVLCAKMWLRSAMERKESRVKMMREDYPFTDNVNWLKWIILRKNGNDTVLSTEDIQICEDSHGPPADRYPYSVWEMARKRGVLKEIKDGGVVWA